MVGRAVQREARLGGVQVPGRLGDRINQSGGRKRRNRLFHGFWTSCRPQIIMITSINMIVGLK
jgi:hypothetical protein